MADVPNDLAIFRTGVRSKTGLPSGDVGIAPDQDHLSGGGYHCGRRDLISIGKFHPAYGTGDAREDYSVRQAPDRNPTDDASAVDVGDDWPNGGRAAFVRWNNLVLADLRAGRLPTLRAVNFTPDGAVKRRYDSFHPSAGVIPSTDTVLWHTHLEWWRNTVGTAARAADCRRILALIDQAITGRAPTGDGSMDWQTFTAITLGETPAGFVPAGHSGTAAEKAQIERGKAYTNKALAIRLDALIERLDTSPAAGGGNVTVSQEDILAALESPRGQAALRAAVNAAEDS